MAINKGLGKNPKNTSCVLLQTENGLSRFALLETENGLSRFALLETDHGLSRD
jgi:hypothetical protein